MKTVLVCARHNMPTFQNRFVDAAAVFASLVGNETLTPVQLADMAVKASVCAGLEWGGQATELAELFVMFGEPNQQERAKRAALLIYQGNHFK